MIPKIFGIVWLNMDIIASKWGRHLNTVMKMTGIQFSYEFRPFKSELHDDILFI